MSIRTLLVLLVSHGGALLAGFALGVYLLPIFTAPAPPDQMAMQEVVQARQFVGEFERDRADSDFLHWGQGEFSISESAFSFTGELSPGPDYRLYLSPEFVETEADFNRLKPQMVQIASIKTFENFLVNVPPGVDPGDYSAAIVWCETFGQFITSGGYTSQ